MELSFLIGKTRREDFDSVIFFFFFEELGEVSFIFDRGRAHKGNSKSFYHEKREKAVCRE